MYMFNPEIEQMPLKRLRQLQNERLQKLLSYVYERVPFYRRQWEEAGIRPA
ncbi:MAG: phenylacetate--CoA ligase, partial [Bacteroidetes bacterium]